MYSRTLFCGRVGLLIIWGAVILQGSALRAVQDEPTALAPMTEVRSEVAELVRQLERARTDAEKVAAVLDLCWMHHRLVTDPRFDRSDQLQGFRTSIDRRLSAVVREIQRSENRPQRRGNDGRDAEEASMRDQWDWSDAIGSASSLAHAAGGGPGSFFGRIFGSAAGPPFDYGPELVELIQSTIQPEFWQREGGPGRIHYYRPLRIIVVGGTLSVHEDTARLLRTLRALGR